MRAAIYSRISTTDKDQNPEAQLLPLREFAAAQGWAVAAEFTDRAPATDLRARMLGATFWSRPPAVTSTLCWSGGSTAHSRSVLDAATTLERLRAWGVGLRSYTEPWLDTTSPFGEALYYITAAYAQLERGILAERVRAGMERARRQGRRLGRPGGTRREGFRERWRELVPEIRAGAVSRRCAARVLGVSRTTIDRLLAAETAAS
jgi:DNA invertase Pin-like site-specific DNA recombinase